MSGQRGFLDACVLTPSRMRILLMEVASEGLFTPLWSPRVLEEWVRAAARRDPEAAPMVRTEIALMRALRPEAEIVIDVDADHGFDLPDENDIHVLAAALEGRAQILITANLRDFPVKKLRPMGIVPLHPDAFLWELAGRYPEKTGIAIDRAMSKFWEVADQGIAATIKRAGMPRLAKLIKTGMLELPSGKT